MSVENEGRNNLGLTIQVPDRVVVLVLDMSVISKHSYHSEVKRFESVNNHSFISVKAMEAMCTFSSLSLCQNLFNFLVASQHFS